MLGGCCVCADDHGYEENPLVYCDGAGCDVAVHQSCYGIVRVPEESWFCARCETGLGPGDNARCELCTAATGALKRTSGGGWAHVICALYIPEVKFGDVHSMEPVITSDIPAERFNSTCYICEGPKGACMSCNLPSCKRHFHVTCAQYKGLLCEEGGDSKNVKYCGYCSHHHKKILGQPGIKFIPAFRSQGRNGRDPHHSSSGTSTPVHNGAPTPTNGPNGPTPINHPKQEPGFPFASAATAVTPGNFIPVSAVGNLGSVPVPTPPPLPMSTITSLPSTSAAPPMSIPPAPVLIPPPLPSVSAPISHPVVVTQPPAPTPAVSAPSTAGSEKDQKSQPVPATMARAPGHTPAKRGRPPGSTNANRRAALADGEDKPKRPRKSTKKTVKSLLESVSHVVEDTVSSFQAERVASQQLQLEQQQQNATAAALLGLQAGSGLPPHPPPPVSSAPLQPPIVSDPSAALLSAFSTPTSAVNAVASGQEVGMGAAAVSAQALPNRPRMDANPHVQGLPSSLEQLLERQWDQSSQFLMEQSQHFDVVSLLNSLQQLKSENAKLEKDIASLSSRKEQLLAVNARLSVPYSAQSPRLDSGGNVAGGSSQLGSPVSTGSLKGSSSLASPTQRLAGPTPSGMSPVLGASSAAYRPIKAPEASPERAFLVPRTPTPLLHSGGGVGGPAQAAALAALHHQYASMSQDQLLLLQQQALTTSFPAALSSFLPVASSAPGSLPTSLPNQQPPKPPS